MLLITRATVEIISGVITRDNITIVVVLHLLEELKNHYISVIILYKFWINFEQKPFKYVAYILYTRECQLLILFYQEQNATCFTHILIYFTFLGNIFYFLLDDQSFFALIEPRLRFDWLS